MFARALLFGAVISLLPKVSVADTQRLARLDGIVATSHPQMVRSIISSVGAPDENGLIGRNKTWGSLYSVRFQYGAGRALRYASAVGDLDVERMARSAIQAGLAQIAPDGSIPASVPNDLFNGRQPSASDQASAAAFFLSDICPALLIAGTSEETNAGISLAMGWLSNQVQILRQIDANAPNRLLIDAMAFEACGQLIADNQVRGHAAPFIQDALGRRRADGVFIEAGGSDTSYQAVSLVVAMDLAVLSPGADAQNALLEASKAALQWLASKIGPDGVLDSSSNTRTCAGELFIGRPKDVDHREVFRALAYGQALGLNDEARIADFQAWLESGVELCQ